MQDYTQQRMIDSSGGFSQCPPVSPLLPPSTTVARGGGPLLAPSPWPAAPPPCPSYPSGPPASASPMTAEQQRWQQQQWQAWQYHMYLQQQQSMYATFTQPSPTTAQAQPWPPTPSSNGQAGGDNAQRGKDSRKESATQQQPEPSPPHKKEKRKHRKRAVAGKERSSDCPSQVEGPATAASQRRPSRPSTSSKRSPCTQVDHHPYAQPRSGSVQEEGYSMAEVDASVPFSQPGTSSPPPPPPVLPQPPPLPKVSASPDALLMPHPPEVQLPPSAALLPPPTPSPLPASSQKRVESAALPPLVPMQLKSEGHQQPSINFLLERSQRHCDAELSAGRSLTMESRTKPPTAVLVEQPAWHRAHFALAPAPLLQPSLIGRGFRDPSAAPTASRLSFPLTSLFVLVVDTLAAADHSPDLPSVNECGLIGLYLSSEVQRSAGSLDERSAQEMEERIHCLCSSLLDPSFDQASGAQRLPVLHIARFVRCRTTTVPAIDRCAHHATAPVVLRCAIRALYRLLLSAQQHAQSHSQPPADLAPIIAFAASHTAAINNSFYLCQLLETLFLMPVSSASGACDSSSQCLPWSACVAEFRALYELSMDAGVFELLQLLCAYVWRVACVVMETREGTKRRLITDLVRTGRKRQREEERGTEEAMVDTDSGQ